MLKTISKDLFKNIYN